MFDFSNWLDLPLIWGFLIATAVFLYVFLDGFDLGIGILFPFAPTDQCRDRMMNSIAPFWDGNETWLVLGGGGLFAAFPLAYATLFPAFYIPLITMLLGLILRGVAFEFRYKADKYRALWDYVFHFGSLIATICQGTVLGAFVQGITVTGRNFSGGPFDWASGLSVMTGIALVFGYALLGATWLIMKTENITQVWARKVAAYVLFYVCAFMALVSFSMPLLNADIKMLWFSLPNFYYLFPIPLVTIGLIALIWYDLHRKKHEVRPFFSALGIFILGYLGITISLFPWIVPFHFTVWQAAASNQSLSLLLIGITFTLPIILAYTGYCYYIFRGKTGHEPIY